MIMKWESKLDRRNFLKYAGLGATAATLPGLSEAKESAKPNVVLIFTDDMGYGDLESYGAIQYETPHLERMADEGMRFTNFYVSQAVCSASRASLLTGCYANRVGINGALMPYSKTGLNPEEETVADLLKGANYSTAVFGKWHLGHHAKFLPLQHGFDEYLGLPYSNDMWPVHYDNTRDIPKNYRRKLKHPELPLIEGNEKIREIRTIEDQNELTTIYTDTAVDFIHKNSDNPFFLYLAHSMPHVPLAVSDKFRGKSGQGLYGDVIMEIDWSVGQVTKALDEAGVADNTLVIFISDNGPWLNFGNHAGSAGGLREGKGTSFEGGQRVPAIMKWPGKIPTGSVCNKIAATMDILPSIADIAGCRLPEKKIDGVDILPLMKGEPGANPRRELYYYYGNNRLEAVRKDNWKLVLPHGHRSYEGVAPGEDGLPGPTRRGKIEEPELYNLRRDPGERYNVISEHPAVVEDLKKVAAKARADLGDSLTGKKGANRRKPGRLSK